MRDCVNCKHCYFEKSKYTNTLLNKCKCENDISKMSIDELKQHIDNGTCKFFEMTETVGK